MLQPFNGIDESSKLRMKSPTVYRRKMRCSLRSFITTWSFNFKWNEIASHWCCTRNFAIWYDCCLYAALSHLKWCRKEARPLHVRVRYALFFCVRLNIYNNRKRDFIVSLRNAASLKYCAAENSQIMCIETDIKWGNIDCLNQLKPINS